MICYDTKDPIIFIKRLLWLDRMYFKEEYGLTWNSYYDGEVFTIFIGKE